jgi:hypothetical protein
MREENMKTEAQIRQAIAEIEEADARHCQGRPNCADASHAINGTYLAVLKWVLGESRPLWRTQ